MDDTWRLVDEETEKSYPVTLLDDPALLNVFGHETRSKIISFLAEQESYPLEIAEELDIHEQTIYYHMKKLEESGIVEKRETEARGTPDFYSLQKSAYAYLPPYVQPIGTEPVHGHAQVPKVFTGLIRDGRINCTVVVGASTPHGPFDAEKKDQYFVGDLTAILGRYGTAAEPFVFQDIDINNMEQNFVIVGGFIKNTVQGVFNDHAPIRFKDTEKGVKILSTISDTAYTERNQGIICRFENPFARDKTILMVAGLGKPGSKAAIRAFFTHFDRIEQGNRYNRNIIANVVEGEEKAGQIADISFLE